MAEFDDLRHRLVARRAEREAAASASLRAADAVVRLRRQLGVARRTAAADDDVVASLAAEHREAVASATAARERLAELIADEAAAGARLAGFTNPVDGIARLDDGTPILLFPLRIETRFKPSPAGVPQLWVRVYPDTCLIDGFQETLSATEVANGTAFWAAVWRAVGDEGLERAAWRELVAAASAGRAGWIVRTLAPKNPSDKPEPTDATLDLIVVATGPEPSAVATFWAAVWSAQGDPAALQQARVDLVAAVGSAEADRVVENPPVNLADPPPTGLSADETTPRVTVLQLADAAELGARTTTWSGPPTVHTMPERLVLLAYSGAGDTPDTPQAPDVVEIGRPIPNSLQVGPDPNAAPADQLKPTGDDPEHPDALQIPEALRWMFEFERALDVGMAFRFDLTTAQAADGFARVVVLGVRITDSADDGSARLAQLIEHHLHSRAGLELLRHGTPTNNTEQLDAGHSWRDDPDASFRPLFKQQPQYARVADLDVRRDGQRFADALGLPDDIVRRIPGAGLADRSEAHAMQVALWPGTIGYLMDSLLAPVFSDTAVADTRRFFTSYVSGRGPLAALRIGDQPYGIQPAVALRQLGWFPDHSDGPLRFPAALARLVRQIEDDWQPLVAGISRIGGGGADSDQELLDVIGLHPASVEYYPLMADGLAHKAHELSLFGDGLVERLYRRFPQADALALLRRFGYGGDEVPDLLTKIYHGGQKRLDGPLIDTVPLSEVATISPTAGGRNYIEWLADAARDSIATVQAERGFDGGGPPTALLYLMLRHALQLGFREAAIGLLVTAELVDAAALRNEPAFVHVEPDGAAISESRYAPLFATEARITGDDDLALGDYIARNLRKAGAGVLPDHVRALDLLATLPTARLERLFAEHIDTATYRLDAWRTGLYAWGLDVLRSARREPPASPRSGPGVRPTVATPSVGALIAGTGEAAGLYLGAYGWVEHLRPEGKTLTPVTLATDLADVIDQHATTPLTHDASNLGLVHAPSINHATTAAVLRNAHIAHGGAMSVDLSSRRVQRALTVLEGMRAGQSIGALLGYQFERHVHDHGPVTVRDLVYELRREYPLVADRIASTATTEGLAQDSIAAMNVVDGRTLIQAVDRSGTDVYPFGNPRLPQRSTIEENAVTAALRHIRDVNDAVADLVLAEGVHQAVSGNFDRAAGTLDAFAKGNHPPDVDVIRTPRPGTGLTLRTAIHLPAAPGSTPVTGVAMTALATAEPAVNAWIAGLLPADPDAVGVVVQYGDLVTGDDAATVTITQAQLGLQPADLLYIADSEAAQALADLDERILARLHEAKTVRIDRPVVIRHTQPVANVVTFFELEALLRSVRRVVLGARSLRPADLVRQGDARTPDQAEVVLPRARLAGARAALVALAPGLVALRATLADPTATIDDAVTAYVGAVGPFASYRIRHAGTGFAFEWRASTYAAVVATVTTRVAAWTDRLDHFDELLVDEAALPPTTPADERLRRLRTAEVLISTTVGSGLDRAAHRTSLAVKRAAFVARRDDLDELTTTPRATLVALLADAEALADVSAFDPEPLDVSVHADEIARFRAELATRVDQLEAERDRRVAAADGALTAHDAAPDGARADLIAAGLRGVFGDDFLAVAEVALPAAAATELANAWAHSTSGDLTRHLTDAAPAGSGRDFPEEDWLHGIARVRDKLHHLENVVLLAAGLPGGAAPTLTPVQLPHEAGQPWLALEVPADFEITSERLLYNVVHDGTFDPAQSVRGLLVDEWTEVIPARMLTTGVAFHHDRPNAEPPQTWLLALPSRFDGSWSWSELVGAVTETLDAAKLRAIEPSHLDATPYAALLPATYSAWTFPEISISNNLLRNVAIYPQLALGTTP